MSTIKKIKFRRLVPVAAGLSLLALLPASALSRNTPLVDMAVSHFELLRQISLQSARPAPVPEVMEPFPVFLQLSNGREELLERYETWARENPELYPADIVIQVNMGLDRPFYTQVQTAAEPDSLTVLVNKYNILPDDYVPALEALGADYGGGSLRPEAAQAFRAMADAAKEEGVSLRSVSAYRSYQTQQSTYGGYLRGASQAYVDTFSARAGHSEHQTGLAVDINVATRRAGFENTPAFAWLKEHCAEYGFILRYGEGKEEITGYHFEPWHYRYVGVEVARACTDQGLAYEEYMGLLPG